MRIAFLGSKGIPGRHGVEVVVEAIASRLAQAKHDVTVYGYDWYIGDREKYLGCSLRKSHVLRNRLLEMPLGMIGSVNDVSKSLEKFDVLHIHSADPCFFAGKLASRVPIVATSHGRGYRRQSVGVLRSQFSKVAEKRFLQIPDVSTCVSPVDTDFYNGTYDGCVRYIPNGMPELGRGVEKDLDEWGLEKGKYILFSAGRLLPSKGLHILIEAYNKLSFEIPLVIVGGPSSDLRYYKEQLKNAPINAIFTGFVSDSRLWSLYRFPRIAVFPSEAEAQSMTLLEFLAMGIDVVYSDIPENVVVANGIGHSFRSNSSDSLCDTLKRVMQMPAGIVDSDCKRNEIIRMHNWDRITDQYVALYSEAISLHSSKKKQRRSIRG